LSPTIQRQSAGCSRFEGLAATKSLEQQPRNHEVKGEFGNISYPQIDVVDATERCDKADKSAGNSESSGNGFYFRELTIEVSELSLRMNIGTTVRTHATNAA
jgi:hypothetical protein